MHIAAFILFLRQKFFHSARRNRYPMRRVDNPEKDNGFQTITNGLAADVKPCKVSA